MPASAPVEVTGHERSCCATVPVADLPDVALHYELAGSGPRLLVVNGTGTDLRRKPSVLDSPLTSAFEVLAYDHRGLGRSVPRTGAPPPTMASFAADALALTRHLGWDRFAVLGISFGGMVAQEVALAGGAAVTRLVLACTSAGGAGGASAPLHEWYPLPLAERARALTAVTDLRTLHDDARREWMERFIVDSALAESGGTDQPPTAGLLAQLEARRHHDTWDRLPSLAVPTLVAAGRHDGIAPLANAEALAARIPGATLAVFDGGHVFFLEDAAAWPAMIAFLLHGRDPATGTR